MELGQVITGRTVTEEEVGLRLDRFVELAFDLYPSRSSARKAVKRGEVLLDGQVTESSRFVTVGQRVEVREAIRRAPPPYEISLEVAFEDEDLAVVIKPPGLGVNGTRHRTFEHALPANLRPTEAVDALRSPRPAHRLDTPTGGLVACAKTRTALMGLGRMFEAREVHKRYRAVVTGALQGEGEVRLPIDGRDAHSEYRVIRQDRALRGDWISTVDLFPRTGRTHQLRRHLAALGHPILGDTLYGEPGKILRGKGLFLWAVELGFAHPVHGEAVRVEIEEPAKFESLRQREVRRWRRWHGEASE